MADINRPSFTNLDQTTALENINNLQTGIKQGMQNIVSGDLANASSSLANITDQFNALVDSIKNNNMFEQLKDKIEQTNLMIDEFRIKTEKGIETQEKSIKSMTESLPKVLGLMRDMESSVEGLNKKFGNTAELEKFSSQIMDMKKNFDEIISMPLLDDGTAINSAKKVAQIYIENMQTAFQMADIGKDIIISSLDNGKEEIANEIKKILSNTQVAMNIVPNINNYEGSGTTGTDLSVFNKLINEISVLNRTTAETGEKTSKTLEKINAFLEAVDTTKVNEIPAIDKNAESTEVLKEIRQDLKNDGTPKAGDNIASDTLKDYVNSIKDSLTKYSDLQNQVSEKAEKVQVAKEKYDEKPITRRKNVYEKANTDLEDTTKQLVAVAKEIIDSIKNYKENISPTISSELTINGENAKEQIENINNSAVQDLTKYDNEIDKIESIKQLLNEIQELSDEYFSGTTENKAFDLNQISNFANKMNDIEKIFNSLEGKEIIGDNSLENSKLLSAEIDKLINSLNDVDLASGILDSINDLDISKYITEKLANTKIKLSNLLENDNIDALQVSSLRNTEQTIKSIINNQNLENTTTEDNSYTNKSDIDNKSNLVNNVYQNVENIKSLVNSTYLADQVSGKNEYAEELEDILSTIKDIERSVSLFQSVKQYGNENTEFSNTGLSSSIDVLFNNFSKLIEDLNTKTEKVKESSNYGSINNDMSAINNLVSQYNTPVDNTENNEIVNNIENLTRTIINSGSEKNNSIVTFRDNINDINRLFNDLNSEINLNISLDDIRLDLNDLNIGSSETLNTEDIDYINNRNINDITSNVINNASSNANSLSSLLNNISSSNQNEENNVNTTNTQNTENSSSSNINTENTTNNLDNRQNSNVSNILDQINSNIDSSNISNLNNQNTDISNLNNENIDLSNVSSLNNHNISDIINNSNSENTSLSNVNNLNNEVSNLSNINESNQNNVENTSNLNNQDSSISNVNQLNNESNSSNNVSNLNNIDNSNRENTNLSSINNLNNENIDLNNVSSLNNQNINYIINNLNNESTSSNNVNNISNNKNVDSNILNNQDNSSINRINQSNVENTNNLSLSDINNLSNEDIELNSVNNQNISDIVNNLNNQRNVNNTDNSNYEDNNNNINNIKNLDNSSNDVNNLNNDITNLSNSISENVDKSNNENIDLDNVSTLNNQNINDIVNNLNNTNIETVGKSVPSNNISNLSNQNTNLNNEISNLNTKNVNNLNNQNNSFNNESTNLNNEINNLNNQQSNLNNVDNTNLNNEVNNLSNQQNNLNNTESTNLNNQINNLSNEISNLSNSENNVSENISNLNNQNTNLNNLVNNLNNNESSISESINNLSNQNVGINNEVNNSSNQSNLNNVENTNLSNEVNNLSNEISNLADNSQNTNLNSEINNLRNETSNLTNNQDNSSNNVSNLNNQNTNLSNLNNNENNIFENINNSNNQDVSLNNKNDNLNSEINNLSNETNNLNNSQISNLNSEVNDISSEINNLSNNQTSNLNNEISNLNSQISNLNNNLSSNESVNLSNEISNLNSEINNLSNNQTSNLNNEINNLNSQISNLNNNLSSNESTNLSNEISNLNSEINNLSNNENVSSNDEVNNAINQTSNLSDNKNINLNNETNNINNEISSNTNNNLSNIENTNLNNDISNLNNEITNLSNNEFSNLSSENNSVNNLSNENIDLDNVNNINNRNISDIINNLNNESVNLNNVDNSSKQFDNINNLSNLNDNSNINNISNENTLNDDTSSIEDVDIESILNSINNENFISENTYSTIASNLNSESNINNSNYSSNETNNQSNLDDLFKQLQLSAENINYNNSERILDDVLDSINIIQRLLEENPDSAQVEEVVNNSIDEITNVINNLLSEENALPESQIEYFKDLAENLKYLKEDNGQIKFAGEVDEISEDSQKDIKNLSSLVNNIENNSNVLSNEGDVLNELNSINNQNIAGILNNIDTSASTFNKNDTVEKIISISNKTLSSIIPELDKINSDELLKEIVNSLNGVRNEISATLENRKDIPEIQTEELKNIVNTIDETLNTKIEDIQVSRLKENEIERTNEFENSVNKTKEQYNNIIFNTDENNPEEMLSAVDTFIKSLKQSVTDYENLAKSVTDLDLNQTIADKLELMSGTSQVINNEFHENIDEEQSEELTRIINQVNDYKDQKNDYINYLNSVNNSNTDNSNNNGGNIINKNIFEKIEDFGDIDLNKILYTATNAKEQLRNTTLDMISGNLTTNPENNLTNIEAIDNIMKDYTSVTNSTQMIQSTINNINSLKEEYDNSEDKTYQDILKTNMENLYGVLIKLSEDISNSLSSATREKNDLVMDNDNNKNMRGLSISLGRGNSIINQELNKINKYETYESEETNNLYNEAFEDAARRRLGTGESELDNELFDLETNVMTIGQNLDSRELEQMLEIFDKIKYSSKEISDTSLVNSENLTKYIDDIGVSVDDLDEAMFMLDSILEDNEKQIIKNDQLEDTLRLLTNIDNILKSILSNNGTNGVERNLTDTQVNKIENIRKTNKEFAARISKTDNTNIDTDISDAQKRMEEYYSIIHYSKDIFERQRPSIGINALKAVDKIDEIRLNDIAGNYSSNDRNIIKKSKIIDDLPDLKENLLDINALSKDKSAKQDKISINMTELNDMVKASKDIPEEDIEKRGEAAEEIKDKVRSIEELLKEYANISIKLNNSISNLNIENLKKINDTKTDTNDFSSLYETIMDSAENDVATNNSLIEVMERFGMNTDENFNELYNKLKDTSKETADRINSKSGGLLSLSSGGGFLSGVGGILSTIVKGISGILGVVSSIFNTVGRIFGVNIGIGSMISGTVDYYKKFGQMDIAGTQAQMKQGNVYNPGLLEYNKDMGIELYKRTYGLVGYDEYANQSNALISQVQGHWGNDQSKLEGQMDMVDLSYPALLLNKVYDVDSTSAIKTFYKDIGMTAQETEAFMYKLVQTAQVSNIPVSEYVKTIENLALKFKELGLNADVADISIQNLMMQGMDFSTAASMTGEYGGAISRFSQNNARTGFYGVMSGQFDTVWEGMKAARDRWNDDGSVKEGSSEIVAKMIDSELGMYSGILNANEDYKWAYIQDYFQKLGFSEKNSAILTNKYTSGDMEGFGEFFEKFSEEAEDENAVTLVNQDQLEAKLQVAADNTDELTKANSMLQATQMELARVSNNMIDLIGKGLQNIIAALGGIMLKLAEVIASAVDALSPLLGKLIEHPILALLAAIATKLGVKGVGSLLKSAATGGTSAGLSSTIVNSLASGSAKVPVIGGVIDTGVSFVGDYVVNEKTLGYSAGSAAGKGIGAGVGAWGGAKAGAAIGTAIAPGIGTAIGTVIGAVAGGTVGHLAGGKATETVMDSMGVQEYRNEEEQITNNYYNSSGTNYSTNLTGMLTGGTGYGNNYTNSFYQYTGLTPYQIEPYESAFTTTYNIDDLYEIQDTQNTSTNKLLNQYQMSQEKMTNLVTEKIEDAIEGQEFKDDGAKIELIAETLQNMGYDRETSYELAEKYVSKDMDGFNQKIRELTETMSEANRRISSNSYTFDTSTAGRGVASMSTTNNNTTIYNTTPQAMERLAEIPGATDMTSGQYEEVINFVKENTYQLTRSDIEDINYESMDTVTRKQAEALTNILNRYEENSTSTSLTQNFEKFSDDTISILEKELNKANFANKNYGIGLFGEDKEEAILNLISTTARDKQGLYELLSQEKYNLSDITDEFNNKFKERIESMGNSFARMNYGQKEAAALEAALEVINEILKDTNEQINNNTDALKNAKLNIDTDEINSRLAELGINTRTSDLDVEALENKKALSAIRGQILQQDIKNNIENNQRIEDTLIQKNYAMNSSYLNSVDYVHELIDQYNSIGSGSYSKDLNTYQDNISKALSDGFLANSSKFKDESDLFKTLGNNNETILELSSLAVSDKEELYSVLSKVAGNESKISDLMEKLYSQNMDKYREIVYKDGKELQGSAGYEIAVATEVMKDALKKEKYLENNDSEFVKYGTLESLTKNFRTDKLTSSTVSDINFGRKANVLDNVDTKTDSIMLQGKNSSIYGEGTNKIVSERTLEAQEEIHETLNQQIAESQNQANSITNNFATVIETANNEFELLQTIANIGNYILNCLRVTQTYNKNIAEDIDDIARAKVTMKVKTTNMSSTSSGGGSGSNRTSSSAGSSGTTSSSSSSANSGSNDDFHFTGGIREWVSGANSSSNSSNSNLENSILYKGPGSSSNSSGTPMGLREALSATSGGASKTASTSGGTSRTASTSGSTRAMSSGYDAEPMTYSQRQQAINYGASSTVSPGYASNPVSAAAYTNSDYGISAAAYDGRSRSGGESGLGSINEQMDQWDDLVIEMANKYGMDPALIKSIIYQESGGDPNATSYAGAMGLMQLMPGTAQEVAAQLGWSNYDPYDPRQSVEMGTYYLSNLISTYGLEGPTAEATYANGLAAYNWGN